MMVCINKASLNNLGLKCFVISTAFVVWRFSISLQEKKTLEIGGIQNFISIYPLNVPLYITEKDFDSFQIWPDFIEFSVKCFKLPECMNNSGRVEPLLFVIFKGGQLETL